MMRRIIIGDLHGNYVGLRSILEKTEYTKKDKLIFVGDYNDHFPDIGCSTKILINDLIKIEKENPNNTHFLLGNHDQWFIDWMSTQDIPNIWWTQGGKETLDSYERENDTHLIPKEHVEFYNNLLPYYVDDKVVIAHGGIPFHLMEKVSQGDSLSSIDIERLIWDRDMVFAWGEGVFAEYKKHFGDRIFICGHTAYRGPYMNIKMPWYMIDMDFRGNGLCALVIDEDNEPKFVVYEPKEGE